MTIILVIFLATSIFGAGFLCGQAHEQREATRRWVRLREAIERLERNRERGAVTGETLVTLAWVACVAWAVVVLALWWGGS